MKSRLDQDESRPETGANPKGPSAVSPNPTSSFQDEFDGRLTRVRQLMADEHYDALVAADDGGVWECPDGHTRYLSNFAIPGHIRDKHTAVVVPLEGDATLVSPAGPLNGLAAAAASISVLPKVRASASTRWPPGSLLADDVLQTLREEGLDHARIGLCGTFPGIETVVEKLPNSEFRPATKTDGRGIHRDMLERVRSVKSLWEIDRLRKAQECAEAGLTAFMATARPGVTYNRAIAEADYAARSEGATEVVSILSAGRNPWCWWIDGGIDRTFVKGDLVAIEFNARVDGYIAQVARSGTVGLARPGQEHVIETAIQCLNAMRGVLQPGVTGGELWDAASDVLQAEGLEPWGRFGHGMGLTMAESVDVMPGDDNVVAKDYCLELHAGVIDKRTMQSALIGDQFLVTDAGAEHLSPAHLSYTLGPA